jgi:hypothetical protein
MAGFQVTLYGRFWASPEGRTVLINSSSRIPYTVGDMVSDGTKSDHIIVAF